MITRRSHHWSISCVFLLACAVPSVGGAVDLFPRQPSTRDTRYLTLFDYCGAPLLEPAELRLPANRGTEGWILDVYPTLGICGVPPDFGSRVNAVELPRDTAVPIHGVTVRLHAPAGTTDDVAEYFVSTRAYDTVPPSITGTWYDPGRSGQGIYLSHSPIPSPGETSRGLVYHRPGLSVVWATYDRNGAPLWLVGTGHLNGFTTRVPLHAARHGAFPGQPNAAAQVEPWGEVQIEYLGCGQLQLRWQARDAAAFPAGESRMVQLTTDSSNRCDLERMTREQFYSLTLLKPRVHIEPLP